MTDRATEAPDIGCSIWPRAQSRASHHELDCMDEIYIPTMGNCQLTAGEGFPLEAARGGMDTDTPGAANG